MKDSLASYYNEREKLAISLVVVLVTSGIAFGNKTSVACCHAINANYILENIARKRTSLEHYVNDFATTDVKESVT